MLNVFGDDAVFIGVARGDGDNLLEHLVVATDECLGFQIDFASIFFGVAGSAFDDGDACGDKGFSGENLLNLYAFASVREEEGILVLLFIAEDMDETADGAEVCRCDVFDVIIPNVGVRPEDAERAFALHGGFKRAPCHVAGKRDVVGRKRRHWWHIWKNYQIIERQDREVPVGFRFGLAIFATFVLFVL